MFKYRSASQRILALTLASSLPAVAAGDNAKPDPTGKRYALLIGAGHYPHAGNRFQSLDGPPNDVELLRGVLKNRYEFRDENIVALRDGLDDAHLPTKENIRQAFEDLAKKARPGDYVVILFCGHGTQQLDLNPESDDEPDGLDEVFLPIDVYFPEPKPDQIPNAITDDEIHEWIGRIGDQEASVFVIFDCCHSGTALRGGDDDERTREVDPSLLVSETSLQSAAERAETTRGGPELGKGFETGANVVAIYAAQPHETTPEKKFRGHEGEPVWHGLLSYNVCRALSESTDLTYRELGNRIQGAYMEISRFSPTPFVDGKDLDEKLMGGGRRRAPFKLTVPKRGRPTVDAGSLNGLSDGCILAVYPATGAIGDQTLLGYVAITSAGIAQSVVEAVGYKGRDAIEDLPNQARCEIAFVDFGDLRLAVAVDLEIEKGREDILELLEKTKAELEAAAAAEGAAHRMASDLGDAQWVIQERGGRVELIRADCARIRDDASLPLGAPRFPLDESDLAASTLAELRRLFRAENLLRLAAKSAPTANGDTGLVLSFRMLKLKDKNDLEGEVISPLGAVPELKKGDFVCWEVVNEGREAADVTLLFIDSRYVITPLFPKPRSVGTLNRVPPRGKYRTAPIPVTAETVGREYMALIAVRAEGAPKNFTILAEDDIDEARRGGGDDPLSTPLGRLLEQAVTLKGEGTRGLGAEDGGESVLSTTTWLVRP